MTPSFLSAFQKLLGNEGGYVDNPADPGGATMWGITQRVARAHGYTGAMQDLPQSTAMDIAYAEYWKPHQLDALDPLVAFQVFDAVYNGGPAGRWLQQAADIVNTDGIIGPATIEAVNSEPVSKIIGRFDAYRLLYMAELGEWPNFGRGWARRIANNILTGEV
ncbi:MAG: glycosyl hydrolase 108 family protein [Acidocella sp.]|nr:glycosyl hydrolase 108 family protein [Acidocella sp.]